MSENPLQQYFRQPRIFVGLPSHGVYNKPGTVQGDADHMPVFGMTGMDEIIMKTPDALLSGESTVKVIQSCCPAIKDAWDLAIIDLELLLAAIRIATYGNNLTIGKLCSKCETENEYEINLNNVIDHYQKCHYNNKLKVGDLTITLRPITYKQSNDFSLRNFQISQKLLQTDQITDEEERKKVVNELFKEIAVLQNEIYSAGVESIDTGTQVVSETHFIREWLSNSENHTIEAFKKHYEENKKNWSAPESKIKCTNCGHEEEVPIELDGPSFFVGA